MKFLLLILKNIRRNLVLSSLTSLGTVVLVLVVTLVWSVLAFLDRATAEKSRNLKAIVTERWQFPNLDASSATPGTRAGMRITEKIETFWMPSGSVTVTCS